MLPLAVSPSFELDSPATADVKGTAPIAMNNLPHYTAHLATMLVLSPDARRHYTKLRM